MASPDNARPIFLEAGWYLLSPGATIAGAPAPTSESPPDDQMAEPSVEAGQQRDDVFENAVESGNHVEGGAGEEIAPEGHSSQHPVIDKDDDGDSVIADIPHPTTNLNQDVVATPTSRRRARTHRTSYTPEGLLLDPAMAPLVNSSYDPFWILDNDIDLGVMTGFTSPIKLEQMFLEGALQIGDIFRAVLSDGSLCTEKEAEVTHFPEDGPTSAAFPTFRVFTRQRQQTLLPRPHQTIERCTGIGELYGVLMHQPLPRGMGYRVFRVFRRGEDLGNLFDIRQALHVWLAEKKMWQAQRRRSGAQV